MKTTIEICDSLLEEAKALASRDKVTLRSIIEEALRKLLLEKNAKTKPYVFRDASWDGGGLTPEMERKGGWARIRDAAYPGFFDDEEDDGENEK
ncbi:MAG TPA: DUF2191 domain-containing protein [Candidatus Binatia bacterium]|nr:DUF2191 domain-containing protein [Candidatus Binatia bacterium]